MLRWLIFVLLAVVLSAQTPVSDIAIQNQLRERLAKSVIGKDGFTPRVKDGVVYWEGSTSVAQHKGAATRMAKSAGARRVVNNIRVVKGGQKSRQAAPATAQPAPKPAPKPTPRAKLAEEAPAPKQRVRVEWQSIPQH